MAVWENLLGGASLLAFLHPHLFLIEDLFIYLRTTCMLTCVCVYVRALFRRRGSVFSAFVVWLFIHSDVFRA
jgi:hypothetical protein